MLSNEDLMWMYRKLVLLRQAEERLVQLSNQGKVGTLLAGVGQEAIPVGAVKPWDLTTNGHRLTGESVTWW